MATITSLGFNISAKWEGSGLREAQVQLDELKASLREIGAVDARISVTLDDQRAKADLDALRAELRDQSVTIQVNADTAKARAELDAAAKNRSSTINVRADDNGTISRISRDAEGLNSKIGLLPVAITALAPAFAALGAVGVGAIGALSNTALAGSAVFGSFGLAVLGLKGPVTDIMTAQKAYNEAVDKYGASSKQAATAQARLNDVLKQANPAVRQIAEGVIGAQKAFQDWSISNAHIIAQALSPWLKGVGSDLKSLNPLVKTGGEMIGKMGEAVTKFMASGEWKTMVASIDSAAKQTLPQFGAAIGNFLKGFINLVLAFTPLAKQMGDGLLHMSESFLKWSQTLSSNKAFQNFLAEVSKDGPVVMKVIEELVKAVGHIAAALIPLGLTTLNPIMLFLKLINAMSPGQIQAIAIAFVVFKAALLGLQVASAISSALGVLSTALIGTGVGADLAAAGMTAMLGPIALVVLAVAAIGVAIFLLVTHWNTVWNAIKTAFDATVTFLRSKIGLLVLALGPLGAIAWIAANWSTVWNAVKATAETVWHALETGYKAFVDSFVTAWTATSNALKSAWNTVWNGLKTAGEAIWNSIKASWQTVTTAFTTAWNASSNALKSSWSAVWNGLKTAGEAIWNAIKAAWQAVTTAFTAAWNASSSALKSSWSSVWNSLKSTGDTIWNAIKTAWAAVTSTFTTAWNSSSNALKSSWSAVWNSLKSTGDTIWNGIKAAWTAVTTSFTTAWNASSNALKSSWSAVWNALKSTGDTIWNAIKAAWAAVTTSFTTAWNASSNALKSSWSAVWNAMKSAGDTVWNAMKTAWQAVATAFTTAWNTSSSALKSSWSAVWNSIKSTGDTVWNAIKAAWQALLNAMKSVWDSFSNTLKSAWSAFWNAIKSAADTVWNALKAAWTAVTSAMRSTFDSWSNSLKSAWQSFWNAVKSASDAVWNAIKAAWTAVTSAMRSTFDSWSNSLKSAWQSFWNAIKSASDAVWNAIKSAWTAFTSAIRSTFDSWSNSLKSAWQSFWNAVKSASDSVWNAMKAAWSAFTSAIRSALDSFANAFKSAWSGLWNAVKSTAEGVWNAIKAGFSSFASGVESTLSGLVSKAKSIWDGIVNVFKTPVNVVIGIWDTVAGAVGLPTIKKLATGGPVQGPGTSTSDSIPTMLSDGEFVMNAKAVDHYGLDSMYQMNSLQLAAGGPVYLATGGVPVAVPPTNGGGGGGSGSGGLIGQIGGALVGAAKGTVSGLIGAAKTVAGAAKTVAGAVGGIIGTAVYDIAKPLLDKALKAIPHPIPGVFPPAGNFPYQAVKTLIDGVLSKLKSSQDAAKAAVTSGGGKGTIPSAQHKALLDQALQLAGIPQSSWPKWESGLNTLIGRESSWNSSSINLTDSNAKAGHPSQGLMQLIPSNFSQYHVAGTSNAIMDPLANIAAGIKYILARYGDISRVQQANASLPPKGYALGTGNALAGWHMVGERGPEMANFGGGERVKSFDEMMTAAASGGSLGQKIHELVEELRENGGGGVTIPVNITASGGNASDVVAQIEAELIPKLRMLMMQGTGRRNH